MINEQCSILSDSVDHALLVLHSILYNEYFRNGRLNILKLPRLAIGRICLWHLLILPVTGTWSSLPFPILGGVQPLYSLSTNPFLDSHINIYKYGMPFLRGAFAFNKRVRGQATLLLRFVSLLPEDEAVSPFHLCLSVISLSCSVAKSRSQEGYLGGPS